MRMPLVRTAVAVRTARGGREVAVVLLAAVAAGCVKTAREVREEVVSTKALASFGAVPVLMRTDYATLVEGVVGLRFEGDVPCATRVRETYVLHTATHREHTKGGLYSYAIAGGIAVAGIGTGLGLGLDATKRDNVAANISLSYGLYLLGATGAALLFNHLRVGHRTRDEGPFTCTVRRDTTECGAGPVAGARVTIVRGRGSVDLETGADGVVRFVPFDLIDAFGPAPSDEVFTVRVRHPASGKHKFDFGLSAAVLRAAADRFVALRALRPPDVPVEAPAVGSPPSIELSATLRAPDEGALRAGEPAQLEVRVRNTGAVALPDVRVSTASDVPGWDGRWAYFGVLAPAAEAVAVVTLPAVRLPAGKRAAVRATPRAGAAVGAAVEAAAIGEVTP